MKRKNKIFYRVLSNSMLPALKPGDIVICANKDPKDIEIGDIVVIDSDFLFKIKRDIMFSQKYKGLPLIHRVIHKENRDGRWFFKTKGDNNSRIDTALQILEKTEDYVLLEYNSTNVILIPDSEIIGIVINKIPRFCSKCGNKILDDISLNTKYEGFEDFGNFEKIELKFYFNKKKEKNRDEHL
ncbi:MAG: signal peptidase I [Promethearchaeota archaeon]